MSAHAYAPIGMLTRNFGRVQGGQDARQARPHQLRDDLNRFIFLLGGSDGERLFGHDQHPGPAGHLSQGQGSHRATNLIVDYGLTSTPGPARVSVAALCGRR
jgi:hypothetical protein